MQDPVRRKVEAKIRDQWEHIGHLEMQLIQAKAYVAGLQDMLKLLPAAGAVPATTTTLREGSDLAKARDILRKEGAPLHLNEIVKRMGKEVNRNSKAALAGSLGAYIRKGEIFTRPAPNSFGLTEFKSTGTQEDVSLDIPDDFGLAAPVELAESPKT